MKEERDDAQYVREFYEFSKKYSTLKVFLFKNPKKQGLSEIDESDV